MTTHEEGLLAARFAALAPEPQAADWEDILARAGRNPTPRRPVVALLRSGRRRQLVVLAAVALVVVVGAASAVAVRVYLNAGIVGVAPVGSTPSTPQKGDLVFSFLFGHTLGDHGRFQVNLYADGRMITDRFGDNTNADEYSIDSSTGLLERRLSPEGVELVRGEVISTGLVEHDLHLRSGQGLYYGHLDFRDGDRAVHVIWGDIDARSMGVEAMERATPEQASALVQLDQRLADPASWLPASAWVDLGSKAYVPSAYSVCLEGQKGLELSRVLALLPPRAEGLLREHESTPVKYTNLVGTFVSWCSRLTNDEARALERILDDAGVRGTKDTYGLAYGSRDMAFAAETDFLLAVNPLLPDAR